MQNRSLQNRSQRARTLARRVTRPSRQPGDRIQWSSLGSVWTHLVVFLAAVLMPHPFAPTEADIRYIELVETEMAIGPSGVGEPASAVGDQAPAAAARPSPVGGDPAPAPERPDDPTVSPTERFARTEIEDAVAEAPEDPLAISANHTEADDPTRAPVTSDQAGDPTPPSDGETDLPGSPTLERRPGDVDAAMGNRVAGEPGPVVVGGGGGGAGRPADVVGPGLGTPTEGGGASEGGPVGGGRLGGAAGGSTTGDGGQATVTAPVGPNPTHDPSTEAPSWWAPLAVRVTPPSAPPGVVTAAAVERIGTGRAPTERPGRRTNTGGTQLILESAPPLPGPETTPELGVRRRIAAPGTADPIVELREALGFGPLDRTKLAPRPEWAGRLYEDGARDSSPQLALDVPYSWKTEASTRGTALGIYVQRADEVIGNRWRAADLDAHSRAVGLQGDVTVRYQVRPDGRVTEVSLVRSSGNPILDEMALDAIPDRLSRFPRELGKVPFHHQVTLHYRNPLVSQ